MTRSPAGRHGLGGTRRTRLALCLALALTTGCEAILGLRHTEATGGRLPVVVAGGSGTDAVGANAGVGSAGQHAGDGGSDLGTAKGGGTSAGTGALPDAGQGFQPDDAGGGGADGGDGGDGPESAGGRGGTDLGGTGGTSGEANGGHGTSAGVGDGGDAGNPGAAGMAGEAGEGSGGLAGIAGVAGFGAAGTGAVSGDAGIGGGGIGAVLGSGSIVGLDGSCVTIAETNGRNVSNPTVVPAECVDDPAQAWKFDEEAHLHTTAVDAGFLEAQGDIGSWEKSVGVAPVAPLADNQRWAFEGVHLGNGGGLCIDVPFGDFYNRAHVQLVECHDGPAQEWTVTPTGQIRHLEYCLDLPDEKTDDGTPLQVFGCWVNEEDNQRFIFDHGRLEPRNSGKCIGAAGDPTLEQVRLEVQSCDPDGKNGPGQLFWVGGPIRNQGLCLDLGTANVPSTVTLRTCTGAPEQNWSWFF